MKHPSERPNIKNEPEMVACDQCEMLSINGTACHEHGCRNARKTWVTGRGWVLFVKCWECGYDVEERETCNCRV